MAVSTAGHGMLVGVNGGLGTAASGSDVSDAERSLAPHKAVQSDVRAINAKRCASLVPQQPRKVREVRRLGQRWRFRATRVTPKNGSRISVGLISVV